MVLTLVFHHIHNNNSAYFSSEGYSRVLIQQSIVQKVINNIKYNGKYNGKLTE